MSALIDIDFFLDKVAGHVRGVQVPVVDLIAVQTRDPFKVLVATILSARTKDETTAVAAARLFQIAGTVETLKALPEAEIEKLIFPVGFFRNKAGFLKALPESLASFNYQVPSTIEELMTLPGVGRKTANLVRSVAFDLPAICVDTHVHRIMNIWRYVETKTPLETEMALRDCLPEQYWKSVNGLLVAFGQSLCKPVRPHCDICPLQQECPKNGVISRTPPRQIKKQTGKRPIRLISWNVNGIRAIEKKGFPESIAEFDADIIALQETKASPDQLSAPLLQPNGYTSFWHSAVRKGYSGVAVYTRQQPQNVITGLGNDTFDCEGRVLTLEFDRFFLTNIYFPNSGDGLKRLEYKLAFNNALLQFANTLRQTKPLILCGDFNVAHKAIDLKNPAANVQNPGYTPEERAWMDSFAEAGYVDSFRQFNQDPDNYTWWSYRFRARARNIGWRIDYFWVDGRSAANVTSAAILADVSGSDHCPVLLEYTP